jgi:hypothetical protein
MMETLFCTEVIFKSVLGFYGSGKKEALLKVVRVGKTECLTLSLVRIFEKLAFNRSSIGAH